MADVFLSYSSRDRSAAEAIAVALEGGGTSVWWDRKISAGASFDKVIEEQLEAAKCVVVIWSIASIESEWVKNEAAAAVERGVLVPVMIEKVRLPIEFRRKQTLDLSRWSKTSDDPKLSILLAAISERLSGPSPTRVANQTVSRSRSPTRRMKLLGAAVAVVSTMTIGALLWPSESTDYTLVCRGGGPFGIQTDGLLSARIIFVPARSSAPDALLPGQCAWTDRPLNSDEPNVMCYSGLSTSSLGKRFASDTLLRQDTHYDPIERCLKISRLQ